VNSTITVVCLGQDFQPVNITEIMNVWPPYFDPWIPDLDNTFTPIISIDDMVNDLRRIDGNDNSLAIGPSMFESAGLGVYALRDFKKGDRLDVYTGPRCETEDQVRWIAQVIMPNTTGGVNDGIYDSTFPGPFRYTASDFRSYGYYVNDPLGHHELINSEMIWDATLQRGILIASDHIRRGEEILMAYGVRYWRMFHYRLSEYSLEKLEYTYGEELDRFEDRVPQRK